MKLIIQIPCYNEEKTLPATIADLPREIEGIDAIEYLIINDGSTDRTVEVAREIGIQHIVNFKQNKGLARAFCAGLDACLHLGADIIVNTDADNQYCADDIEKLIQPILHKEADIVIGERAIDEIKHFSSEKKFLQHFGSWVVSTASDATIGDTTSGFRAYSKDGAIQLNVINDFTYTLETIIQAGHSKIAMASVPIRTNPQTRESRLFKGIRGYLKRSMPVIFRSYAMYKPLRLFGTFGLLFFIFGIFFMIRFFVFYSGGTGNLYIKSLIVGFISLQISFQFFISGLQSDLVSSNRKLIQDIQLRIRKIEIASGLENKDID